MSLLDQNNTNELQDDPNRDYFAELTGPGGKFDRSKYQSDEDMYKAIAKGKVLADQMVDFKNSEFDKLKSDYLKVNEEYKASASLSEIIDQLRNEKQTETTEDTHNVDKVEKPALTQEDLEKLLEQKMTQREIRLKEEENYKTVENKLREQLGMNYSSILKRQAEQLGLSDEDVDRMARKSPTVFFKAFGLDQAKGDSFQSPPRPNVKSDSFTPANPNKRTWSYYEDLKKKNPTEYLSGKIQAQMFKDMQDLGDAFQDGNYQALRKL